MAEWTALKDKKAVIKNADMAGAKNQHTNKSLYAREREDEEKGRVERGEEILFLISAPSRTSNSGRGVSCILDLSKFVRSL